VLLARNVYVSDHSHAYADVTRPVRSQGLAEVRPVSIGDGAWLGQGVVVCPGVSIGRGSVIGAGSVVLEDIPDHSVAVGTPARVVRSFGPRAPETVPA
jgi:acetyltransferase-like isoleucine patch superfamily enzyme